MRKLVEILMGITHWEAWFGERVSGKTWIIFYGLFLALKIWNKKAYHHLNFGRAKIAERPFS